MMWLNGSMSHDVGKDHNSSDKISYKRNEVKKYVQVKIDNPLPPNLPKELELHKKFYANYVTIKKQTMNARECHFEGCNKTYADISQMRKHHMGHYSKDEYEKFQCNICYVNHDTYRGLQAHVKKNNCIKITFPPERVFYRKALDAIVEQQPKQLKKCNKCGHVPASYNSKFFRHLHSCYRFAYPCDKCGLKYAAYQNARLHSDLCNGIKPANYMDLYFRSDIVSKPLEESKSKTWTHAQMLEHMKEIGVPKLRALLQLHPNKALITIGQTHDIKERFKSYSCNWQVYKNFEFDRYIEFDSYVLFKCWSRFEALWYEYLLQVNTQTPSGIFFNEFGTRSNKQRIQKPGIVKEDCEESDYYVYVRCTRKPFVWRTQKIVPEKDSEQDDTAEPPIKKIKTLSDTGTLSAFIPSTSKGFAPSTSKGFAPAVPIIVISSSSESSLELNDNHETSGLLGSTISTSLNLVKSNIVGNEVVDCLQLKETVIVMKESEEELKKSSVSRSSSFDSLELMPLAQEFDLDDFVF
ncbi:unnamed protein product [Chironomus riparius]|uniref:C2H2-type domain-containing protein n=1 Tax=Chironomus riparius TaxID=315576 RepID=A0A9N9RJD5_9DIPT|nr:unnamed protein product [Chironomus riparius]